MEFRHRRDKLRAGEPYSDGGELGFLEQPGVERLENPGANEERKFTIREYCCQSPMLTFMKGFHAKMEI